MGCLCPPKAKEDDIPTKISKLRQLRSSVLSTIEVNKIKIEKAEKEIQKLDAEIKEGENDLRQNQYSYSEQEQKAKAKKLFDLQKDRQRAQKSLNLTSANNENLKNNLTMIDSKIDELTNYSQLNAGEQVMKEIGNIDTGDALQKNIAQIMRQQQKDDEQLRILEGGNRAVNADLGINSADDYLKQILGGNGTSGAPPAY